VRGDEPGNGSEGAWLEVAHEALIRRWERLGQWLREEGDRVLALRTLRGWAQEWARHRNDSDGGAGYLPVGSRLTYVRELREKYPEDTQASPEKEFLAAAEAAGRQRDEHFLKSIRIANRLLVGIGGIEGLAGLDEHHRSLLEQVEQMLDNLIQSVGAHPMVLRVRAVACIELGKAAQEHGNWDEAWEMYESAMRLSRDLCGQAPSDFMAQEQLTVSHDKLSVLARRRGDLDQALEHDREAVRIAEKLVQEQPSEVRFQIQLSRVLRHSGELMLARKELDLAQASFERALAVLPRMHGNGPSPELKPQLASCLFHLGELAAARDCPELAEKHYLAALGILETVPAQPAGSRIRLMFAELYSRLGWLAFGRRNMAEALRRHLNALHLLEALAEAQPRSMHILWRLAISLRNMGEVKNAAGELEEARFYLSYAQSKIEVLRRRAPAHTEYLVDEFVTEFQLGNVARALGDMPALAAHEASAAEILETFDQTRVSRDLVDSLRAKLKQLQEP
jgi:tetratricopeptide (TPR) repeat protein